MPTIRVIRTIRSSRHARDNGGVHQRLWRPGRQSADGTGHHHQNGRDRLVLVSAEEYERLRRRDRRAFRAEELSEADITLIAKAEMLPEHAHLDEELGDWQA